MTTNLVMHFTKGCGKILLVTACTLVDT